MPGLSVHDVVRHRGSYGGVGRERPIKDHVSEIEDDGVASSSCGEVVDVGVRSGIEHRSQAEEVLVERLQLYIPSCEGFSGRRGYSPSRARKAARSAGRRELGRASRQRAIATLRYETLQVLGESG